MKYFTVFAFLLFSLFSHAQESYSAQIYAQMVSNSNELMKRYELNHTIYINDKLSRYTDVMQEICKNNNSLDCPEVKFTTLDVLASLYPNGVLLINEYAMNRLSYSHISFMLAKQFALLNTVKQSAVELTARLSLLNIEATPEKALSVQGFLPDLDNKDVEKSAHVFAMEYLKAQKLHLDCMEMVERLMSDNKYQSDIQLIRDNCDGKN